MNTRPRYECPRCHRFITKDGLSTAPVFAWHLKKPGTQPNGDEREECPGSYDYIATSSSCTCVDDLDVGKKCPSHDKTVRG
jgi:hypothetical protein